MKFEKLLQLLENKEHFIKKLKNLSDDEKKQIIDFYSSKNWNNTLENMIDWTNKDLTFDDFKKVLNYTSKSERKKSVAATGIKGLKEGEDYLELKTDGTYKAYLVLNFQASILIASNKVGSCVGKWCTAFAKDISFWKEYSKTHNIIYIIAGDEKYALIAGRKIKTDISIYNKEDFMYTESPQRLWLNKLKGNTKPMSDFDKSIISFSNMYSLIKNNQEALDFKINYLEKYTDGDIVDLKHVVDKVVLCDLLIDSVNNLNLTYVLPNDCSEIFEDDNRIKLCGSNWDTSNVTNMSGMFHFATLAQPDTSKWIVSNVTDMSWMFYRATSANPNVTDWDVSSVTNMHKMFEKAEKAEPNVTNWNVSKVTDFSEMFYDATSAKPNISKWKSTVVNFKKQLNIFNK